MRAPRFSLALGAALFAHATLAGALVLRHAMTPAALSAHADPQELVFVISQPPPEPAPDLAAPPDAPLARAVASRSAPVTSATAAAPSPANDDAPEPRMIAPAPADSSGTWSLAQAAPPGTPNLGTGDYWKSVAMASGAASTPAGEAPRPHLPSAIQMVRDELAARDHALGLGAGGPLVAAAHEAASPAFAPDVGSAVFDIEADASGLVTSAELVSDGPDAPAWKDVARELVKRMASSPPQRLHLASGARGLRARLRITAERALPSGSRGYQAAGAVPDDVPGQGGSACVGEGAARKCIAGSPAGVTRSFGDLSNIGAKASRVVHVELLTERTL